MLTFTLAPGLLPPNFRIYAVGDVHGCAAQLDALHQDIAADLADRPVAEARLIHLGDYVDRGLDSAVVIERLLQGPPVFRRARGADRSQPYDLPIINLMGNHEQMMLAALQEGNGPMERLWRHNGGDASLRSWGINPGILPALWQRQVPAAHVDWLRALGKYVCFGNYIFVHAGLRPGVALAAQSIDDMLWIREPFLSFAGDFGMVVVHGHTPVQKPAVRSNRIGIDTGAVLGGSLTCVVLQDDRVGFLTR
jgi:serine/threonine protein phosphatase 1